MQKWIITIIAVVYLSCSAKASDKTILVITDAQGSLGDYITVPVNINLSANEQINPYVIQGALNYDINKLSFVALSSQNSILTENKWDVTGFDDGTGNIHFLASGISAIENNGLLFELIFVITSNDPAATSVTGNPLNWKVNHSEKIIDSIIVNEIKILDMENNSSKVGDANEDIFINFDDVQAITNHLLNISDLSEQGITNSEVNGDGRLTIHDALSVLKYSRSGNWETANLVQASNAYINVEPIENTNELQLPIVFLDSQDLNTIELEINYDPQFYQLKSISEPFSDHNVVNQTKVNKPGKLTGLFAANTNYANTLNLFTLILTPLNNDAKPPVRIKYSVNGSDEVQQTITFDNITSVQNNNRQLEFTLDQNYPNPFNPTTTIKFSVRGNFETQHNVSLHIYDILGNKVVSLVNETKSPGNYKVEFDASGLAAGTYIYSLNTGISRESRKMILLK